MSDKKGSVIAKGSAAENDDSRHRRPGRQIIGLSLKPEVVTEFKTEAARRGMKLANLFMEMWADYQKRR